MQCGVAGFVPPDGSYFIPCMWVQTNHMFWCHYDCILCTICFYYHCLLLCFYFLSYLNSVLTDILLLSNPRLWRITQRIHSLSGRCQVPIMAQHRVITTEVNNCSFCCYVRCATKIVMVGRMPQSKTGATYNNSQLGLPEKGCSMKGLIL